MSEQVKLDYKNLIRMLNSPDEENAIVALECLNNVDFKENMVLIMCLYKNCRHSEKFWIENANAIYNKLKDISMIEDSSSYRHQAKAMTNRRILEKAKEHDASNEQIKVFAECVTEELLIGLEQYGYDFIESINITIK